MLSIIFPFFTDVMPKGIADVWRLSSASDIEHVESVWVFIFFLLTQFNLAIRRTDTSWTVRIDAIHTFELTTTEMTLRNLVDGELEMRA